MSSQPTRLIGGSADCRPRRFFHFPLSLTFFETCTDACTPLHASELAYEPLHNPRLIKAIVARRNPRSGRWSDNLAPKNLSRAARSSPRPPPVKFATHLGAPNYRFVARWISGTACTGSSMGAGHCPAAGRARSPRSSSKAERSELSPWAKASTCTQHTDPVDTSKVSFLYPLGMLSGV